MNNIHVNLGRRSYPVMIGTNNTGQLRRILKKSIHANRLFVFYDANFYALHGFAMKPRLNQVGVKVIEMVIPGGEKSKSTLTLNKIYDFLLNEKISRQDFILACGGGVTSDLVGYASATTLRGIKWGIAATTLLSMVDASIGGKTGINRRSGKNVIGAFWQPSFVYSDTYFLKTLPFRELVAGYGEILKYGGLIGKRMLTKIEKYRVRSDFYHDKSLRELIAMSAEYKANIVARDEREENLRMRLNLGHTFAHAIETAVGYGKLLHGEAVILGLLAAVELSNLVNSASINPLKYYKRLINEAVTMVPLVKITPEKVLEAMQIDKKRSAENLRFLLLKATGRPYLADRINRKLIRSALGSMLEYYKLHGGSDASHSGR